MNRRQKKKFQKKLNCKSYYLYRQKAIIRHVNEWLDAHPEKKSDVGTNLLHIIDSKRMDLKHIKKLSIFTGVYPAAIQPGGSIRSTSIQRGVDGEAKQIEFSYQPYNGPVQDMLEQWETYIKGGENNE